MQYLSHYDSPFGGITLGSSGKALIGVWFDGAKYFKSTISEETCLKSLPVFDKTKRWLDLYFAGKIPDFTPEIKLTGSVFSNEVWEILKHIPYGKTTIYGEIAAKIAAMHGVRRISAQAAGGAVGRNPVSIIIPCHRVIGKNGDLTGYAAGLDIKIKLLELEKK